MEMKYEMKREDGEAEAV